MKEKTKRIDAFLSSLGYCTRSEAKKFLKFFEVSVCGKRVFDPSQKAFHKDIQIDNEPLDPQTLTILLNKPNGVICSHNDQGKLIYSLLPKRWQRRKPKLSTIGRLDIDTTGAILITDDGKLNNKFSSPKNKIPKIYIAELQKPLKGDEIEIFSSGELVLKGGNKALLSARLTVITDIKVELEIFEGRYHQVKRMFAAVGNKVLKLHRKSFGEYNVDELKEGEYKIVF